MTSVNVEVWIGPQKRPLHDGLYDDCLTCVVEADTELVCHVRNKKDVVMVNNDVIVIVGT